MHARAKADTTSVLWLPSRAGPLVTQTQKRQCCGCWLADCTQHAHAPLQLHQQGSAITQQLIKSQEPAHTNPLELSTTKPQSSLSQWWHVIRDSLLCTRGHWRKPLHTLTAQHMQLCRLKPDIRAPTPPLPATALTPSPGPLALRFKPSDFQRKATTLRALAFACDETCRHGLARCDKEPAGPTARPRISRQTTRHAPLVETDRHADKQTITTRRHAQPPL
jgi:hypothetical protein